jgi:DNA-binding beta-propeller fold protein YncE
MHQTVSGAGDMNSAGASQTHAEGAENDGITRSWRSTARRGVGLILLGLLAMACSLPAAGIAGDGEKTEPKPTAQKKEAATSVPNPFPERFPCPDFIGVDEWFNTEKPLRLADLRGKVVLLDFWTYCCINCIHVLPDLKYLENKYPNELVVIGVHSKKFDNEGEGKNIVDAIRRYEIVHPVANDHNHYIWNRFQINSWPSFVLIDPEGKMVGKTAGEGNRDVLDSAIGRLVKFHRAKGNLDETPIDWPLESDKLPPTPLRYPGKIVADEKSNRLFISDSNHNRIVITTLDGQSPITIGSGAIGRDDGDYATATFDHPQGMTLVGETLYVCDTVNHMLRAVDLRAKTVTTIAGTGKQAAFRSRGGKAASVPLSSPWDVVHVAEKLYIAMAGPHQIWVYDFKTKNVGVFAGTGREDITDGLFSSCAFAQPSGIAYDGTMLYVVDSEGSAIRRMPAKVGGSVKTIAGPSNLPNARSLFEFGDIDGTGSTARFQHPLGIAIHRSGLYIADAYNHKIRKVNPETGEVTTFVGDGETGSDDMPPRFSEPAGLAVVGDTLYVADTNNHLIRTVDLNTRETRTLDIVGLTHPPAAYAKKKRPAEAAPVEEPAEDAPEDRGDEK